MTVFWDLIWAVLVGVFIANMLTIDSITETQLEGMEADNPIGSSTAQDTSLPQDEQELLQRVVPHRDEEVPGVRVQGGGVYDHPPQRHHTQEGWLYDSREARKVRGPVHAFLQDIWCPSHNMRQ